MKTVTSSSRENTRDILKQYLVLGVILIRSTCHYYDVKKKQLCFYLSKNADAPQNRFWMEWYYCMTFILCWNIKLGMEEKLKSVENFVESRKFGCNTSRNWTTFATCYLKHMYYSAEFVRCLVWLVCDICKIQAANLSILVNLLDLTKWLCFAITVAEKSHIS